MVWVTWTFWVLGDHWVPSQSNVQTFSKNQSWLYPLERGIGLLGRSCSCWQRGTAYAPALEQKENNCHYFSLMADQLDLFKIRPLSVLIPPLFQLNCPFSNYSGTSTSMLCWSKIFPAWRWIIFGKRPGAEHLKHQQGNAIFEWIDSSLPGRYSFTRGGASRPRIPALIHFTTLIPISYYKIVTSNTIWPI